MQQLTFYLKKSDDDRLAQRSIHIGKQLGQLLMRYWLELKLLFCVYEVCDAPASAYLR